MTEYRRAPDTGQLAQRLVTRATVDNEPEPGSERWVVVFFDPHSGLSMRMLTDDEAAIWLPVEMTPARHSSPKG